MSKFKMYIFLVHICWYFNIDFTFKCVFACTCEYRLLQRPKVTIPIELELLETVNHSVWMLGTNPKSCAIVPNPRVIFPSLSVIFYMVSFHNFYLLSYNHLSGDQ